jgi:hypothetical protein
MLSTHRTCIIAPVIRVTFSIGWRMMKGLENTIDDSDLKILYEKNDT